MRSYGRRQKRLNPGDECRAFPRVERRPRPFQHAELNRRAASGFNDTWASKEKVTGARGRPPENKKGGDAAFPLLLVKGPPRPRRKSHTRRSMSHSGS